MSKVIYAASELKPTNMYYLMESFKKQIETGKLLIKYIVFNFLKELYCQNQCGMKML